MATAKREINGHTATVDVDVVNTGSKDQAFVRLWVDDRQVNSFYRDTDGMSAEQVAEDELVAEERNPFHCEAR